MLYSRTIIALAVTLYTSRVILDVLGIEDFGIYNVVGGVVVMFSMFSETLNSAIGRFITFELGRGDKLQLNRVFSSAVNIQILLSFVICIFAEIGGIWFLNTKMSIPSERLFAANWVLQCSILTFIVNLISIPYNAVIIANEHMKAFAYIGILEIFLKLIAVYSLFISPADKLISYSILLFAISITIRAIYGIYCNRHFPECKYHFYFDKQLLKRMLSFSGWNFIGSTASAFRDQGVNMILNIFCGPVINAARGISLQVSSAVRVFSINFMTAMDPQIIKSYATSDRHYMTKLIHQGAKFSFYLLLLLSLPLLIETDIVLSLWLKSVPDHTSAFVRLILLFALSESLSRPLTTAMAATGRIRNYQLVVGGLQILNFPLSYLSLFYGMPPETTMTIAIGLSQICLFARLYFLRKSIGLSIRLFFNKIYINSFFVGLASAILPCSLLFVMESGIGRFLSVTACCFACTALCIYTLGCSQQERVYINEKLTKLKTKLSHK